MLRTRSFLSLLAVTAFAGAMAVPAAARAESAPAAAAVAVSAAPPLDSMVVVLDATVKTMPWQIRYFESYDAAVAAFGDRGRFPIGTMYPDSEMVDRVFRGKRFLSPQYFATHAAHRQPLVVELPSGHFCIDSSYIKKGVPQDSGWAVTGDPPNVTLTPSVNIEGSYHGFITNGVISDDVEQRQFNRT